MKRILKNIISETHPLRLLYHRFHGWLAAFRCGFPANKLTVIGVTGTDGKTTTVAMIDHILTTNGYKTGAVSTAFFSVHGKREHNPTQKTSVPAMQLQRFLQRLVSEGCTHAVVEASSHGLLQGRLIGITPTVAAITNLSPEHLDYHKTMEHYIASKGLLFHALKGNGTKVLHHDDPSFSYLHKIPSERTVTYGGIENQEEPTSFLLADVAATHDGVQGTIHAGSDTYELSLPIPGLFNLENAVCAIACTESVGISLDDAISALQTFHGAPGRMERIDEGQPFGVFIDFTVTPVAYEKTLQSLRPLVENGKKLIVVTGSCGERMREKRPQVGKICSELADITIVTNEDPYGEDPEKIIDDVLNGVPDGIDVYKDDALPDELPARFVMRISDRTDAIAFALDHANDGDIVLFSGKGGDVTMWTANGQIPWNEDAIVRAMLRERFSSRAIPTT